MNKNPGEYQDTQWWRTHFSGTMLDLWQSIVPAEQAGRDADFLQGEWQLSAGASVLDVPCGNGRIALELASRGFRMVGVDISAGLIREAQRQSEVLKLAVEWHEADMQTLTWDGAFDAAFCWADSFGYLNDVDNSEFLRTVHRVLKPGGRWAMEMKMVAEVLFPRFQAVGSGTVGGIGLQVHRAYDPNTGRLSVEYTLNRGGQEEVRSASYRIYTGTEISRMLAQAGFTVDRMCDGAGEPFRINSDRLRVVATKSPRNG